MCKNNEGTIMGNDLMKEYEILIDCGNGELIWQRQDGRITRIGKLTSHLKTIKVATVTTRNWELETGGFGAICASVPGVWAKNKLDTGLTKTDPIKVPGPEHKPHQQYPIKPEAGKAVVEIVKGLVERGILRETTSTTNSPTWPVSKPDGCYRLTIDYTGLNKVTSKLHPIVASPSTILNGLSPGHKIFTVLDIANGFWSLPLDPESQDKFAFTVGDKQYTWTRLPQGFHNSPAIFHRAMSNILNKVELPEGSTTLQYVDDILLASESKSGHQAALYLILNELKAAGLKVSPKKAQIGKSQVLYLGHLISQGLKEMPADRKEAIQQMPRPVSIRGVRKVLGLFNYSRSFIQGFSKIAEPIQRLVKGGKPALDPVEWGPEQEEAYTRLKTELISAPGLGLPDLNKDFHIHCNNEEGFYSAVVTQDHGDNRRPIGYYSTAEGPVVTGLPRCIAALDCAAWAIKVSEPVIMTGNIILHTKHTLVEMLNTGKLKSVSNMRRAKWEAVLLPPSKSVTIIRDTGNNPAEGILDEGEPHNCGDVDTGEGEGRIRDTPLITAEETLFVDGSRKYMEGSPRTGWAVVNDKLETIGSGRIDGSLSAQVAELVALTQALELSEGKAVNIYSDSRYAFGVIHDYMTAWGRRGFITTGGTPIKHQQRIEALLRASEKPREAAVIKVKAHQKEPGRDSPDWLKFKGNQAADRAAQLALEQETIDELPIAAIEPTEAEIDIQGLHEDTPKEEKEKWEAQGAVKGTDNIWRREDKVMAPECIQNTLLGLHHGLSHVGREAMITNIGREWWWKGMGKDIARHCHRCVTCAQHNPGRPIKIKMGHQPRPKGPWEHLQLDFTGPLPQSHGKTYCLVIIDQFTRWVEAFPTANCTATTVARILAEEVIPRWGVPLQIDSDQGTHFTGKVVKTVAS